MDVAARDAYVYEAELELAPGVDSRAPGGAVTVALCGHWEHEGPCRWPHNNAITTGSEPARFRTLFVADDASSGEVRRRIERALRDGDGWSVVALHARDVAADERELADRLLVGPRRLG